MFGFPLISSIHLYLRYSCTLLALPLVHPAADGSCFLDRPFSIAMQSRCLMQIRTSGQASLNKRQGEAKLLLAYRRSPSVVAAAFPAALQQKDTGKDW